jgi:putative flavoprotein involved in K+ transport
MNNFHYDAIVVGGGQAGLAAGYYLARSGMRFTILDSNHEIGGAWERRWDTLRLFTPARYNALPGLRFPGDPYALPGKSEVAAYLKLYARTFSLPVQHGVTVTALHRSAGGFIATTSDGTSLTAASVIVATGANQRPHIPAFASSISPAIVQIHSSDYRNPAQVPEGKVLVVGAGNSGAQIALGLAAANRTVLLSGRDTGSLPRRLLGRDIYDWLWPTIMRPSVDSVLGRRLMDGRLFAGDPLIDMAPRALTRPGLSRVGRALSAQDGFPVLEAYGVARDIRAIVWCTGFRPDFGWIELPVLGLDGYPAHRRGIASRVPGLGFVGMRFQYRMGSALLGGVGEDAAHVVEQISTYAGGASFPHRAQYSCPRNSTLNRTIA